ncbi:hypothetical protein [Legionella fallonii]|uniref:Uncharacterized protein n=1 Tax=Legionella fallonii LLAP-10 TaxID=1212491 RepID=A0A098G426_9GAMM|nr:hypothetical protein [Legionella fallonii]CEG57233.1 exported protein of unknown function [Legionella fallonii LLAP-10]
MRIFILKPIVLLLCSQILPLCSYAEFVVEPNSKLTVDKSCITSGKNNLRVKFPNITEEDAQYISIYACFCAYKASQKSTLPIEATDFRNAKNCVHYGVLRNAIRDRAQSSTEENTDGEKIRNACLSGFPYDLADDSMKDEVSNFCKCAAIPTEKIYEKITSLKLNEEQISEQLIDVINSCRYSL